MSSPRSQRIYEAVLAKALSYPDNINSFMTCSHPGNQPIYEALIAEAFLIEAFSYPVDHVAYKNTAHKVANLTISLYNASYHFFHKNFPSGPASDFILDMLILRAIQTGLKGSLRETG